MAAHFSAKSGPPNPRLRRYPERSLTGVIEIKCKSGFTHAWETYQRAIQKRPLITNCLTACGLCMIGDFMAQKTEKAMDIESHGKEQYNYGRTMRMGVWGLMGAGPLCLPWYKWLHVAATNLNTGKWRTIGFKLGFDMLLFMPFIINVYFVMIGTLEGKNVEQIKGKIKESVLPSWITALGFWTAAQLINFSFVPIQYQTMTVFFNNTIWNSLISIINHQEEYGKPVDVKDLEAELMKKDVAHEKEMMLLQEQISILEAQLRQIPADAHSQSSLPIFLMDLNQQNSRLALPHALCDGRPT